MELGYKQLQQTKAARVYNLDTLLLAAMLPGIVMLVGAAIAVMVWGV